MFPSEINSEDCTGINRLPITLHHTSLALFILWGTTYKFETPSCKCREQAVNKQSNRRNVVATLAPLIGPRVPEHEGGLGSKQLVAPKSSMKARTANSDVFDADTLVFLHSLNGTCGLADLAQKVLQRLCSCILTADQLPTLLARLDLSAKGE